MTRLTRNTSTPKKHGRNKEERKVRFIIRAIILVLLTLVPSLGAGTYNIVDTGQEGFYDNSCSITQPVEGEPFYGQDAHYQGNQPSYTDNGDGTVTDNVTGLMWVKTPNLENKYTFDEAVAGADTCSVGGYDDWRLPTIKELYSLINFEGSTFDTVPYLDTGYFDFVWGDESQGERLIDAQYWSATQYVGTVFDGVDAVFGVNFADGRIKGYPKEVGMDGGPMTQFVRYVRSNPDYGSNDFVDNGDGTITDNATGLVWQKADDGITRNWEAALEYAENLELAGYTDWRLPNAKELQSIVDYTRAPEAADADCQSAAIDPIFDLSEEQSWFWTSTTHLDGPLPDFACYVTFGQAFGYMEDPPGSGNYSYQDVHGAGAQRSDPKDGDPADWPHGNGPQGDEIRIFNYVRCVRDVSGTGVSEPNDQTSVPSLEMAYLTASTIQFTYRLSSASNVGLTLYDSTGRAVKTLYQGEKAAGTHQVTWNGTDEEGYSLPSGAYFCILVAGHNIETAKAVLFR